MFFQENEVEDFLTKKLELLEKVLEELKETIEEVKYQCIFSTLENTFYDKSFFIVFTIKPKFFDLIYIILEKSQDNSKNLNLIILIEKSNFNFMNDLDDYSSPENNEFMSTYQISQK